MYPMVAVRVIYLKCGLELSNEEKQEMRIQISRFSLKFREWCCGIVGSEIVAVSLS